MYFICVKICIRRELYVILRVFYIVFRFLVVLVEEEQQQAQGSICDHRNPVVLL